MCISTQAGESMGYPGADGCELPFGDLTQVLWKSLQRLTFKTVNNGCTSLGPKPHITQGPVLDRVGLQSNCFGLPHHDSKNKIFL